MSAENNGQAAPIKDARDYAIRKGKILERFTQEFYTKHNKHPLYTRVLEALIRDADPYEIIERLIEINAEQFAKLEEIMPWVSPNYAIHKQKEGK